MRGDRYDWLVRVAGIVAGVLAVLVGIGEASAQTKPSAIASCQGWLTANPQVRLYCVGSGFGEPVCNDYPDPTGGGGYFQAKCGPVMQGFPWYYEGCAPDVKDHSRTTVPIFGDPADVEPQCKDGCEVKPREGTCTHSLMVESIATDVNCSWYSTGQACQPIDPPPDDDDKCVEEGGKKVCVRDEEPQFCASIEGGETICVHGDDRDPPCVAGSTAAACKSPNPPPNPPITHEPPWNPNPPPPDIDITINNNDYYYYGGGTNGGGGDDPPPPSNLCGTAGNPPCPPPSTCGQPGQPRCNSNGDGPDGNECGREGEPVCNEDGNPACGRPGTPACTGGGTPSCGVIGTPLCADDGGPICGIVGRPQCTTNPPPPGSPPGTGPGYGPPSCGTSSTPPCVGGNIGGCGSVGQPPCSYCGGVGQAPCGNCGAVGQPACCGANDPDCENGSASGGGSCGSPPSCSGDSVNCAVLYQTYMTRCAVEDFNQYSDRPNDFGPTYTPADGVEPEGEGVDVSAALDPSGWWGAGSCDIPTSITIYGEAYALDEQGALCSFFGIASVLVLLFAYFFAARIVAGGIT